MSKESNDVEVISNVAPDIAHIPVVAEGTGKTAQNDGAKSRTVYNVRSQCACSAGGSSSSTTY
jgi:hypothetical protein